MLCLKWDIFIISTHFFLIYHWLPLVHLAYIEECQAVYVLVEIDRVKITRDILFIYLYLYIYIYLFIYLCRRYQRLCGLRRGSTAAGLLGLWVRIPPGSWMSFYCNGCVLSSGGLWDGLITRPEES